MSFFKLIHFLQFSKFHFFLMLYNNNKNLNFQRQVLSTLSCIAKHSVELAEYVIDAQVFPNVFFCMKHTDENVARAAATLTKEICKHSLEVSLFISYVHRNFSGLFLIKRKLVVFDI